MAQVILHLDEQYIEEDLEYYHSGERDKNNQIRPDKSVYSMTPYSDHLDMDFADARVGNFFYPILPQGLDRIYIGISVSLFANHWGASFILELLKSLKPGGSIIVPVYPEGQAGEKEYWSRSFLENIFLSRERWTGFSNIKAENDGVMSMRVVRKWPDPMPSSIAWFFKERANLLLASLFSDSELDTRQQLKQQFLPLCELIWQEYTASALCEHIIKDSVGRNQARALLTISRDYGLLANDVLLSPLVKVKTAHSVHVGSRDEHLGRSIEQYFSAYNSEGWQNSHCTDLSELEIKDQADVIFISGLYSQAERSHYQDLLKTCWQHLNSQGVLIVHEDLRSNTAAVAELDSMVAELGQIRYHSYLAVGEIKPDEAISQYSLAIEADLREEKASLAHVFRVVSKA